MKSFEQILRESENGWFKTKPKIYTIQGRLSDKTEKYTNKLEGNSYDMSDEQYADDDWVILKGTCGELWPNKLTKTCKKYGVTPQEFIEADGWIELTTQPVDEYTNWARKIDGGMKLDTMHGEMNANDGAYEVCMIDDIDHNNTWIVHEKVFPKTYEVEDE